MIKTINLNGSEVKITELGGDNTEIFNNSSGNVYASKLPNITAGGDDVISIPSGSIDGLYGTCGTVYLLGTGNVELRGVDYKITKTRGQTNPAGGDSGISESIVDEKCNAMLDIAKTYADLKDSEVLVSVKEYADSLNSELAGYIGYTDNDIYGLEADFINNKFTRLAGAAGKTAGASFDSVNAYGGRRRCNLSDNGEILAYYGDEHFKADGSNGQVMVEQPKFYYRVVPLKTEKIEGGDGYHLRKARYYISDTPKAGFKVHPAFMRDGVEVDKIYLSAFEGCIYDTSAGAYLLKDEQTADFDNDKLSSISDAKPCSGQSQALTLANARKLAHNRGAGWEQMTIQSISVTQLLFIIEYATFDSQSAIGIGACGKTDESGINIAENSGTTLPLGNRTGAVYNSNNIQFVSYRGEENLWGNIGSLIDGIAGYKDKEFGAGKYLQMYKSVSGFSENTSEYINIGSGPKYGQSYASSFVYYPDCDWLFSASDLNGSSAFPIGDMTWNASGKNIWVWVALTGGIGSPVSQVNSIGLFARNCNFSLTASLRTFGVRLTYIPQKNI